MDIKLGDIVRLKSDPPFEGVVCNIGDYYLIPKRPGDIFTIKIKSLKGSYCIKTVLNLEYESNTDLEKIGFFVVSSHSATTHITYIISSIAGNMVSMFVISSQ